jgi:hypothetical protein
LSGVPYPFAKVEISAKTLLLMTEQDALIPHAATLAVAEILRAPQIHVIRWRRPHCRDPGACGAGAPRGGLSRVLNRSSRPSVQPTFHTWTADEFRFRSGDVLRNLRLAYATLGDPTGIPVLCLHGTGGSGDGLLTSRSANTCSALEGRSMRAGISSSCRIRWVMAAAPNHRMACERTSPDTGTRIS